MIAAWLNISISKIDKKNKKQTIKHTKTPQNKEKNHAKQKPVNDVVAIDSCNQN